MSGGFNRRKQRWRDYFFEKQKGLCYYCGEPMEYVRRTNGQPGRTYPTIEHLKRLADGGKSTEDNMVLAHYRCNSKANKIAQQRKNSKK